MLARIQTRVVGRDRELEAVVAALAARRHLLLEGPPGTGKSTILRSVAEEAGIGFEFVEGNAELTPARLIGAFDPAAVLAEGYSPEVFVDGPLLRALRNGSLLYVEEINRIPEETLNVLITVMSEGEVHVPRLGPVRSSSGFRLVAAMNPFDAVGTARIAAAVYDRCCRLAVGYQDSDDEVRIVDVAAPLAAGSLGSGTLRSAVDLVRATRDHPDLRTGSSVRGAIDLALVAAELGSLREQEPSDPGVTLDAALLALSGRIRVREGSSRSAEDVVRELWERFLGPPVAAADPGVPAEPGNS
ncbi:MAG: MoxR family ATPase, partial [Acidobacteria bacterium]|nr:MoxR family ATPase [Acidobacteriota bacterium]